MTPPCPSYKGHRPSPCVRRQMPCEIKPESLNFGASKVSKAITPELLTVFCTLLYSLDFASEEHICSLNTASVFRLQHPLIALTEQKEGTKTD